MSKSLYSVILTDEIVYEIDRLALRDNTNRSNLINQILAEYVSYTTPEMRINSIFKTIENIINESTYLVPQVLPQKSTMSLKGNLDYRYRPTIKYDVELFKTVEDNSIGRLSVIFRTQSPALLNEINEFFKLWCYLESNVFKKNVTYTLSEGKFTRSITLNPNKTYSAEEIANAISSYIRLFDECMKNYLSSRYSEQDIILRLKNHTVKEVLI